MKEYIIHSEEETEAFGKELASKLSPGSFIALTGDLGTGKTALAKAIAKGLGVNSLVTSPTFTIIQEYTEGQLPLYHFDVYRIQEEEDMFELGYEEYFYGNGVCIVEWADKIENLIPSDAILIHIEYGTEENQRIYKVDATLI